MDGRFLSELMPWCLVLANYACGCEIEIGCKQVLPVGRFILYRREVIEYTSTLRCIVPHSLIGIQVTSREGIGDLRSVEEQSKITSYSLRISKHPIRLPGIHKMVIDGGFVRC